jgi:hypothetical protein
LVKFNEVYDIAWLEPEIKWSEGINLESKVEGLKKGDLVFTLGYPLDYFGSEPILSVGFFSNFLEKGNVKRLIVNVAFNVGNSGGPLFDLNGKVLGIVVEKSLMRDPMIEIAFQILEKPGVELEYTKIKFPDGSEEEMTLSKILRMLIKWIVDNAQTNIGEAVSVEYLIE